MEGITDKWYAIPYQLLSFDTNKRKFILSVPQSVIRKAPGVDKNIWGPCTGFPKPVTTMVVCPAGRLRGNLSNNEEIEDTKMKMKPPKVLSLATGRQLLDYLVNTAGKGVRDGDTVGSAEYATRRLETR